jgi:hypothetical protein
MKSRLQFSIANLLVVFTVVATMLAAWRYDRQQLASKIEIHERQRLAFGALNRRAYVVLDDRGKPISIDFGGRCEVQDLLLVQDLPTLREVNLSYCHHISDRAIENLLHLPELEVLYLSRNNPNWVDQFKEGIDMTNQPRITDKALETIAKIQSLKELYIRDNQFSDDGIMRLRSLPNLKKLELRSKRISEVTLVELRRALPNTEILFE